MQTLSSIMDNTFYLSLLLFEFISFIIILVALGTRVFERKLLTQILKQINTGSVNLLARGRVTFPVII